MFSKPLHIFCVWALFGFEISHTWKIITKRNGHWSQQFSAVPTPLETKVFIPTLKNVPYRINQVVRKENINAVRFRHIEVATEELAMQCRAMLTGSDPADFGQLASTVSLCEMTKSHGGDSGWLNTTETNVAPVTPSALPFELINAACYLNKGDLTVLSARKIGKNYADGAAEEKIVLSWHILQLIDVNTAVNAVLLKRRRDNYKMIKGLTAKPTSDEVTPSSELTYSIETMGCQMNSADSERMEGQLLELGYSRSEDSSKAAVVILNTCSIRDHAEQKVYSYIGPHALRKRKGDDVSIIVAGCVAQQEGEVLARRFPEVDIVMGPQYANRIGELLESVAEGNQVVATEPIYQMEDNVLSRRKSDVTAWVNVIYGCNERCTYCVVPTTRGVEQSRTKEAIVGEIAQLVALGFREVTLLGQNVDSWGRDMTPKQKFADLLTAAAEVPGIDRVRFLTSHPKYMSERVVSAVAANSKLAPCFNVPFQSGDDEVLKNMRRGYTRARFLEIVGAIRNQLPDAAITADCIVGFPGETEEQFLKTLSLMEEVKFEMVNSAAYSPRPNTPAADWDNQLSEEVKQDRLQRIIRLGAVHALERSQRFVGRIQDILVEEINPKNPSQLVGRNPHSRLVYFEGNFSELKGKIVPVLITEARAFSLTGEIAGDPR